MSAPILSIKDLSVSFKQGKTPAHIVKKISFDIKKGETLALVGESGSGKSVSALSILQLLPYPTAFHPSGSITFENQELLGVPEKDLQKVRGNKISMIFQEPMTSLNPLHTIEKQISESLFLHQSMSKEKAQKRVIELLDLVGLENLIQRLGAYPHELSGGQRQRVMIAMTLANDPDILIADEPTTALDVTVQAQVLELMKDLQEKLGMAILLITHDLTIVEKFSHRVAVMKSGEIVETNTTKELFKKPVHAYTKKLLNATPSGAPKGFDRNKTPILEGQNIKVHFPVAKSFFGKAKDVVKAVDDISLDIRPGETLGVVGESGSGKSTLGMALLKLNQAQGKILFKGKDIITLSQKEMRILREDIQIVFQDPYGALSPRLTVDGIIREGLDLHRGDLSKEAREELVIQALTDVQMDPETRHRFPHEFSGGQRQRIAIARAMVLEPEFVILDEPTSALDMSVQGEVIDLLRDLQARKNLAYMFISHDLRVVRAISHNVIVMKNGKIVEVGTTEQIFETPQQDYTKKLISAAFEIKS